MTDIGTTPRRSVVAKEVRDLQHWASDMLSSDEYVQRLIGDWAMSNGRFAPEPAIP